MTDLDELERLARSCFPLMEPTSWEYDGDGGVTQFGEHVATCTYRADAAYIAAASPDVILDLIARVRAAEAREKRHA